MTACKTHGVLCCGPMNLRKAYTVLGLSEGAAEWEVRAAYRDLVQVWHPDRFAHSPRLRAKAEAKLKEINVAFDTIKSAGFPPHCASRAEGAKYTEEPHEERAQGASSTRPPTRPKRMPPRVLVSSFVVLLLAGVSIGAIHLRHLSATRPVVNHLKRPAVRWAVTTEREGDGICRGLIVHSELVLIYGVSRYTEKDARGDPVRLRYGRSWMKAVDRRTGAPVWERKLGDGLVEPVVAGDSAFMGFSDGSVRAIRADTGSPLWQTQVKRAVSQLLLAGGVLCVRTSGEQESDGLYGVSAQDGSVLWHRKLAGDRIAVTTQARIVVVSGSSHGAEVCLLESRSGEEIGKASAAEDWEPTDASPRFRSVYVELFRAGDRILIEALDAPSLRVRWKFLTPDWFDKEGRCPPSVYETDSSAYLSSADDDGLVALDTAQGVERWSVRPGEYFTDISSGTGLVCFAGTSVDGEGRLLLLNAADGSIRWRTQRRSTEVGPVLLTGGWLYYGLGEQIVAAELPSAWLSGPVDNTDAGAYHESDPGDW